MIKGSDLDKEILIVMNKTIFDLSEGPSTDLNVLYNKNKEILIHKIWVKYIEATSADAGSLIVIGTAADTDAFATITTEVSKSALYSKEYDFGTIIVPRDTLVQISAGDKTGTGTCYVILAYSYND